MAPSDTLHSSKLSSCNDTALLAAYVSDTICHRQLADGWPIMHASTTQWHFCDVTSMVCIDFFLAISRTYVPGYNELEWLHVLNINCRVGMHLAFVLPWALADLQKSSFVHKVHVKRA